MKKRIGRRSTPVTACKLMCRSWAKPSPRRCLPPNPRVRPIRRPPLFHTQTASHAMRRQIRGIDHDRLWIGILDSKADHWPCRIQRPRHDCTFSHDRSARNSLRRFSLAWVIASGSGTRACLVLVQPITTKSSIALLTIATCRGRMARPAAWLSMPTRPLIGSLPPTPAPEMLLAPSGCDVPLRDTAGSTPTRSLTGEYLKVAPEKPFCAIACVGALRHTHHMSDLRKAGTGRSMIHGAKTGMGDVAAVARLFLCGQSGPR